jgi:peptidoglycan/xylan/chitin deacetylase (PgdA/CDA1 family)
MKTAQCWDDGNVDDIRVIEILRKYGTKASFNLNFGLHQNNRVLGWKFQDTKEVWRLGKSEIAGVYEGFLIANHSLTHPWLDKIPIEEATREIREGKDALEQHFGYAIKGFAYPYGTYNKEVQEIVRATGHVYARTGNGVDESYPPENPMAFASNGHFLDPCFWQRFEKAKANDGVFYFWGHSYEIVTEADWAGFEKQIARISAENPTWVNLPDLFEA